MTIERAFCPAFSRVAHHPACIAIGEREFRRFLVRANKHRHSAIRDMQARRERGMSQTAREISMRQDY